MHGENKIHPAKPILWIVLLIVMAWSSWLPAQIGNPSPPVGGGGLPGSGTNPFTATSTLALPAAQPTLINSGQTDTGISFLNVGGSNTAGVAFFAGGAAILGVTRDAKTITTPSGAYCWENGGIQPAGNSVDTCYYRLGPAITQLGNATANDESGLQRSGNSCRVTADITLSTSPTTVCLFPPSGTLPAVAKPWRWRCDFLWSVTAGTTPTLTVGVNPSQTPTGTTNAAAELKTTNANVATENAVALSASGNTNILTTPTLTPAATIFSGSSFGTLLASSTAGTFAITMTGTGASFAGVARAGTGCDFF